MPPRMCLRCATKRAALRRPKTGDALCRDCFFAAFEDEVHQTIVDNKLFTPGDVVAIGASGGKDSTVLAYILNLLNTRHHYNIQLQLLSIDEGISGYRDDSLESVKRNMQTFGLPLKIVSYEELYGWTMDAIVREVGRKNNCTFCGVFRRQALDRGALLLGARKIATGHNADDIAETVIMNILRGDIARLHRCTAIITGVDEALPRCKPFKYTYEKEIVMYAYFKHLDYFSTECVYAPNAYRGFARTFLKDLEAARSSSIVDIIHSGEAFAHGDAPPTVPGVCIKCGYLASQQVCKACVLLEGLRRGEARLAVGKAKKNTAALSDLLRHAEPAPAPSFLVSASAPAASSPDPSSLPSSLPSALNATPDSAPPPPSLSSSTTATTATTTSASTSYLNSTITTTATSSFATDNTLSPPSSSSSAPALPASSESCGGSRGCSACACSSSSSLSSAAPLSSLFLSSSTSTAIETSSEIAAEGQNSAASDAASVAEHDSVGDKK